MSSKTADKKISQQALAILLNQAKKVQKGNLKAVYGAYRVHTRG